MDFILHNYIKFIDFDIEQYEDELLSEVMLLKEQNAFEPYSFKRPEPYNDKVVWPIHGKYLIARLKAIEEAPVLQKIQNEFNEKYNVLSKGRYIIQPAETNLPTHKDKGTQCALNYVVEGTAPIIFHEECERQKEFPYDWNEGKYFKRVNYKKALINVQKFHSVPISDKDRILFKLSIFDKDFFEKI